VGSSVRPAKELPPCNSTALFIGGGASAPELIDSGGGSHIQPLQITSPIAFQ
jgi:hypothetical protein